MTHTQTLNPDDFVDMTAYGQDLLRVELAYAREDNALFGERIYKADAKLWLFKGLADIVVSAAKKLADQDLRLVLYDGLRTTDAQSLMLNTQKVRDNPHWLEEPRLLSPPGAGAHPRGMAIDCALETMGGQLLDMGCPFDFLAVDPAPEHNPAHRSHDHARSIMENRAILDQAMNDSARDLKMTLLLLPQEWWDFRLLPEVYERYDPICESALPADMRML